MDIRFSLCLPRDEASVPVVRHICSDALKKLGVAEECVSDIALALTEACSNVLHHAEGTEEEYEVSIEVNEETCEIRVIDAGIGFEHADRGHVAGDGSSEGGRGIFLMRALVDRLEFRSVPEKGTEVHLVKRLALAPDAILASLTRGRSSD